MMDENLCPTEFIDCDSETVRRYAREVTADAASPRDKAIRLYYAVRDGILYDPYRIDPAREAFRAGTILQNGYGYCVAKAILLAALLRACDIPCRLHFADVRNHLTTKRLRELMQTDTFYYHGYNDIFLDGRWIKVTPTFNLSLCEKFKVKPLEWDGEQDAVFHPYDMAGRRHMEYIRDHGSFADVPYEAIMETFRTCYGPDAAQKLAERQAGAFDREAQEESK
ncbi:MAG: transglutaminase family protein [Smithellaceae bacterium]